MKKLGVIFAIIALVTAFAVIGCASSGGGGGDGRYVADLKTFSILKNTVAFTKIYDGFAVPFPEFPVDITQFKRITVRARSTNAAGDDITAWSDNAQVRLVYDLTPRAGAPAQGGYETVHSEKPRSNVLFYEYNVGFEGLGNLSNNEGILMGIEPGKTPAGIYVDCSSANVKFIEITEIIFHNGSARAPVAGGGGGEWKDVVMTVPFNVEFKPNFQYGRTWQNIFRSPEMLNGYRLTAGDVIEVSVAYTVSRDVPNEFVVNWTNSGSTPWVFLSLPEGERDGMNATTKFPACKVGQTVEATLQFNIVRNGGGGAAGNAFVMETAGTAAQGPVTLTYTKFEIKRVNP
jgi:hypothetical protein